VFYGLEFAVLEEHLRRLGLHVVGIERSSPIPGVEYVIHVSGCDWDSWRHASRVKSSVLPERLSGRTLILCEDLVEIIEEAVRDSK
jgi:hypothetical protein